MCPPDDPIILEPERRIRPMGSDDPIILDPPDTHPAGSDDPIILEPDKVTTVKPQGLHNWKTVIKQYSTWVLLFVMAIPEAFQLAVSYGIVTVSGGDDPVSKAAQFLAAIGLALKFIKQQKPA